MRIKKIRWIYAISTLFIQIILITIYLLDVSGIWSINSQAIIFIVVFNGLHTVATLFLFDYLIKSSQFSDHTTQKNNERQSNLMN